MLRHLLLLGLLSATLPAATAPPKEAIAACQGKSTGSTCAMPHGVSGKCRAGLPAGYTACLPAGRRLGLPAGGKGGPQPGGPPGGPPRQNGNKTVSLEIDQAANESASETGMLIAMAAVAMALAGSIWAIYMTFKFRRELVQVPPDSEAVRMHDLSPKGDEDDAESVPMHSNGAGTFVSLCWGMIDYFVDVRSVSQKLQCQTSRIQILEDVHGYALPGTVTAIMGPSGSGKTTLLNVIAGRSNSGWLSGLRIFNGQVLEKAEYEVKMSRQGYVLQTDTFFPDLTVLEMLTYCAMLRIGESATTASKLNLIDKVLSDVNLEKQFDSVIGGQASGITGISGGQRRRLSVAIELLTNPSILILDEPTSGLDATSSHQLVTLLNSLAIRDSRTVLLTIHQPRAESFAMFDQLILLGEGGRMTYLGEASKAAEYLSQRLPDMELANYDNPGDFIIDAVGLVPTETSCMNHDLQTRYVSDGMSDSVLRSVKRLVESTAQPRRSPKDSRICCGSEGEWHSAIQYQVWVLFARRTHRRMKHWRTECAVCVQLVLVALVLGYALQSESDPPDAGTVYQEMMFVVVAISYLMILQYLITVPEEFEERPIYLQDRLNRSVRPSAHVLSSILTDSPRAVVHCLLFYAVSYHMVGLNPGTVFMGYTVAVSVLAVVAWQAVIGFCASLTEAQGLVYTCLFVIFSAGSLFGGLCIPYQNLKDIFKPFYYLSIPAWGYRSILVNDLACCHLDLTCDELYDSILDSDFKPVRDFGQGVYEDCANNNGTVPLGQLAILYTDLAPFPEAYNAQKLKGVAVLIVSAVLVRWLSMVVLRVRTKRANFLEILNPGKTLNRMRQFESTLHAEDRDLCTASR